MVLTLKWFPTSCVQLSFDDKIVYIDPGFLRGAAGLAKADMILATHHHMDHLMRTTVRRLSRPDSLTFGPPKCLRKLGNVAKLMSPGDHVEVMGIEIEVVHAYNLPRPRRMTYHKKGTGVGYLLTVGGKKLYHAGDTSLIEEMSYLGNVDIALLPIGGKFTMDIDQAVKAVKIIRPREVVPIHMLNNDPQLFKTMVERETETKVRVLSRGEATEFA